LQTIEGIVLYMHVNYVTVCLNWEI